MKKIQSFLWVSFLGMGVWASWAQDFDAAVEITPAEMLRQLREDKKIGFLEEKVDQKLEKGIADPVLREEISGYIHKIMEMEDPEKIRRFPLLPLKNMKGLRLAFMLQEDKSVSQPKEKISGTLEEILARDRPLPQDFVILHPQIPELKRGSYSNPRQSSAYKKESLQMAEILTALSLSNDSWIDYNGKHILYADDLLSELMNTGHHIELESERSYANFIALNYKSKNVRWPGWVDTGLNLSTGKKIIVPMGHSQINVSISGPQVNARLSFFLGISGVGYFANTYLRPEWTGSRILYKWDSSKPEEKFRILTTLQLAREYATQIVKESKNQGVPNAQNNGYGYLGVCNDSIAAIEKLSRSQISSYPLLRDPKLKYILAELPVDDPSFEKKEESRLSYLKDAFFRILQMHPFPDSHRDIDEDLRSQMIEIREDLTQLK